MDKWKHALASHITIKIYPRGSGKAICTAATWSLVSLWEREKPGYGKNRTSTRVSTKRMIMTALQVIGDRWLVNGRIRDQKRCQRSPLALHLHLCPLTIDKQCQWLAQSLNTRTLYSHIWNIATWNNVSVVHTSQFMWICTHSLL